MVTGPQDVFCAAQFVSTEGRFRFSTNGLTNSAMFTEQSKRTLTAGVARTIITPPVGIRMLGYTAQDCVSESVERELTATALVLTDSLKRVAILACDIVFIQQPYADRIRKHIGENIGIPAANVLINCSHTHLGPMLPGWQDDTPEQERIQQQYLESLEESLVNVATEANSRLQPARIGAGIGSSPIGINRREKIDDDGVIIGENLDGAVDNEVGVIRIDALDGSPIAVVMKAAAHTVVLGPRTAQLSPDYVGPAREILESATGAMSLFLQGAAGNVNPSCGIGRGDDEQYRDLERLGGMLAGEALKTWAQIRTHVRRGPRQVWQSVAAVLVWNYETLPEAGIEHFDVCEKRLTLPMAPLPDRETTEHELEGFRLKLADAEQRGSVADIHIFSRLVAWAEKVHRTIDEGEDPVSLELVFWGLRINEIGIVTVSGEPFAEIGLEIKGRSPLEHTFFLGYSNGCIGYLPTPEAFGEGGMEVNESCRNYLLPSTLTPEWGPAIVKTSLEMLERLK